MNPGDEGEYRKLLNLETTEQASIVARQLKELLESSGWAIVKLLLQQQVQARKTAVVLQPLGDAPNAVYAQEFMKGEIAGIGTMLALPGEMYELAHTLVRESVKAEPVNADGNDSTDTFPDSDADDDGA